MGADPGILSAALDARLRAVVLVAGGLSTSSDPGEIDPLNFAPRVTAPVLLIAGRDDFRNPLKLSQEPLMHSWDRRTSDTTCSKAATSRRAGRK